MSFVIGGHMSKTGKAMEGYVKKETTAMITFVAILVGFIAGIVYSSFKLGDDVQRQTSVPPPQTVQDQGASPDQTERIKALEKETSSNPKNVEAWILLGNLYFEAKKHLKAIEAYKKSLELSPNNANVLMDMGIMYRRAGQPDKAIETFEKAMEIDPRHEASRFNKGIVLMHDLNDLQGAVRIWEELLKLNPNAKSPTGMSVSNLVEQIKKSLNR